jgi:hypothetical protein
MTAPSGNQTRLFPRRAESAQARKVGPDTLVLHALLKQYHVLNHTAGRIWELADGTLTTGEIAAIITAEYHADESLVSEDVAATVEALADLRILEIRAAP